MLKQKSGVMIDMTARKIHLTYHDYEIICEALAGMDRKSSVALREIMDKRKRLMRYIVTEWKKQDEVEDGRRS